MNHSRDRIDARLIMQCKTERSQVPCGLAIGRAQQPVATAMAAHSLVVGEEDRWGSGARIQWRGVPDECRAKEVVADSKDRGQRQARKLGIHGVSVSCSCVRETPGR